MVEAYCLVNQKLQDSVSEQSNMEKFIMELKVPDIVIVVVQDAFLCCSYTFILLIG